MRLLLAQEKECAPPQEPSTVRDARGGLLSWVKREGRELLVLGLSRGRIGIGTFSGYESHFLFHLLFFLSHFATAGGFARIIFLGVFSGLAATSHEGDGADGEGEGYQGCSIFFHSMFLVGRGKLQEGSSG